MKTLYALIASTMLAACGSMSSYVHSAALERYVAQDVTARLSADYPAANTLFVFDGGDPFGKDLGQALREKGFAVADSVPGNTAANRLSVVLDKVDQVAGELYRVSYTVDGRTTYTRGYLVNSNGNIAPAGSWSRK
ncbi:conjugal transfer protein TrbH [Eikenella exigua]|uniref:Conjugal transfer protein TrbH n=1 Tax=Eikenella exigua TaxID=2528037 RepID=A0AAX1FA88_9NEIS|nr:conjugal transfer protein TrbH [Eikenella exigua]QED93007.1 conjugal transfer protein TrbH [Eikenella exigua]